MHTRSNIPDRFAWQGHLAAHHEFDRYSFLQGIAAERRRAFADMMAMREEVEALKAEALDALLVVRAPRTATPPHR